MISQRSCYAVVLVAFLLGLAAIGCQEADNPTAERSDTPTVTQPHTASDDTGSPKRVERHCELILLNPGSGTPSKTTEAKKTDDEFLTKLHQYERDHEPAKVQPGVEQFKRLHHPIPDAVKQAMHKHNICNYTVYLALVRDEYYAVRNYEYSGTDYQADMAGLERDPDYRQWRDAWEACQVTMLPLSANQWWAPMQEIGHVD